MSESAARVLSCDHAECAATVEVRKSAAAQWRYGCVRENGTTYRYDYCAEHAQDADAFDEAQRRRGGMEAWWKSSMLDPSGGSHGNG